MVIMGSGDEVRLRFRAAGLPALPAGWKRDFLLLVDGWAKDADANTAFSQSVQPLPFHGDEPLSVSRRRALSRTTRNTLSTSASTTRGRRCA